MKFHIFSLILLVMAMESKCSSNRFFISAPGVFHVGVFEKVSVQMSKANSPITLYLEHETTNMLMSEKKLVECNVEDDIKTVELMIDTEKMPQLAQHRGTHSYLVLVAESPTFNGRKTTKVLVSKHKGNIFIQTDQPIYNPTQTVKYRIFSLDHTFRPHAEPFLISVFNAAGNRIMRNLRTSMGGIFKDIFHIPESSKMGTWKITAHYEGDEENTASCEFKVQKFVLPSFEVNIAMTESYILMRAQQFHFTISAKYSHGENVKGAYHCQFGVIEKSSTPGQIKKPDLIRGMELTGSVKDGTAAVSFQLADLNLHLQKNLNQTLSSIRYMGSQIYLGVFVTNIQSGEIQNAEVNIPVIDYKYIIDLSRTRSHFIAGYPLDVVALVHLPDGSPAANVPVHISVTSTEQWQGTTDQDGAVFQVFNIGDVSQITVEVSTDEVQKNRVIQRASSPSGSFLYISLPNRLYSVGDSLAVSFNAINPPQKGFIYYMILSRGILVNNGKIQIGTQLKSNLPIRVNMVPSFRLIAFYYDQGGNIIADSAWVDVRDKCEINVKIEQKGSAIPGKPTELEFDLHGQNAKVALLAVDKAIYALHAKNRLTAKQVFSSMESYDLGCTYSGGSDPESILTEAGLSFVSQSQSKWKKSVKCNSRQRRSLDLEQERITLKSNFSDEKLRQCCDQGFSSIPMKRTCQERARRVSLVDEYPSCADVFLTCCLKGEILREKIKKENARKGLGRTDSTEDIEYFFLDTTAQYIRRYFPPSFAFTEFDVNSQKRYQLSLPDSITTWEIQVITLSPATGFCVVPPSEIKAFKNVFVSLRLPYSVRKYEQLSISPVIYNYGYESVEVAVHMQQTEGLCSPGSATTTSFVNVTVEPQSSQFVFFSAVPMVIGPVPIKIRLYDIENDLGIDAIEKTLNVMTEGLEKTEQKTHLFNLDGMNAKSLIVDGNLPGDTVPDSSSNIFISAEGNGFHNSHVKNLLSPEKVASLIVLPTGCLEQTMIKLAPSTSALRYLDLSDQWFDLPAGSRDDTLDKLERGYAHIVAKKKPNGSYGTWRPAPYSNWMTALVVKVLSLLAERQTLGTGQQGRRPRHVPLKEIRDPVRFLLSVQKDDGSFGDPNPVLHRGVLDDGDRKASMTAFITIALYRSLQFLDPEGKNAAEERISRSTKYLQSHFEELKNPYAVAITAYCLAVCLKDRTDHSSTWAKLQALSTQATNGCYLWTTNASPENQEHSDAITVDSTSYALLTAVTLGKTKWADRIACWLTTQENYLGGFKSTQDTLNALEALAEYELQKSVSPEVNVIAEFSIPAKTDIIRLALENKRDRVETNLKKFIGNNINMHLTGNGEVKMKVLKSYHLLEPKSNCDKVSISVTVEGKVKYTEEVIENYEFYDYGNNENSETEVPETATKQIDDKTPNKRDFGNNVNVDETVTYKICVSHSLSRNLTGMAIADITLLSGFEVNIEHLDKLMSDSEQYISHYESHHGRVLLYFNQLFNSEECIEFDAVQTVPIGLLQPAPALFYDYYEPDVKCTVFYSAPSRSKMVSKLCSEDVCQCAERPCHKMRNAFKSQGGRRISKEDRMQHACFFPTVDYGYMVEVVDVSMKSNFEIYKMTVTEVLKSHGDMSVRENSVRLFAKRRQCKGQLVVGKEYLIMGKDGSTTDSSGMMQYLLESNTWVEPKPLEECRKTKRNAACKGFEAFTQVYKTNGCRQ